MPRFGGARDCSALAPPNCLPWFGFWAARFAEFLLAPVDEAVEELILDEILLLWLGESYGCLIPSLAGVAVPAFPEADLELLRESAVGM